MKLTLGFSPCPNDTFIFDALVNGKLDLGGLTIEPYIADVEELNRLASRGELELTKLSYHAFAHLTDRYALLHTGSALGKNCGPLLIARKPLSMAQINEGPVAIPGKLTTANFLFSLAWPKATNTREMVFSDIEDAVLQEDVAAGLIIHENRFTYAQKGLHRIMDLGAYWEQLTGMPIPLGGIAVRRDLPQEVQKLVNNLVGQSVRHARKNPGQTLEYVSAHAQEMDPDVMKAHIQLYVNDFTEHLGYTGTNAVERLMAEAINRGIINPLPESLSLFVRE
jgi:1,4-dihydroxy-6-naphthoate synthase